MSILLDCLLPGAAVVISLFAAGWVLGTGERFASVYCGRELHFARFLSLIRQ